MNCKKIYFQIVILLFSLPLLSQQRQDLAHIRLKTHVEANQIKLRWAVDMPLAWQKSVKRTFILERYTLLRSGTLLDTPEQKVLGEFTVPQAIHWQQKVEDNDYAAIIAQALFGETFETDLSKNNNPIEGIFNKSQDIQQRFSFALMAADLDFNTACFAGWGFVDTEIRPDEKYLYKIFLKDDPSQPFLQLEEGLSVADASQKGTLPAPVEFLVLFKDKKALVSWNYALLQDTYNTYFVERSDDGGKTFKEVSTLPIMALQQTQIPSQYTVYQDSLPENHQIYHYRLRGKNIFGSYGTYSEVLSGEGKETLQDIAQIVFSDIAQDQTILLRWEYPQSEEHKITHFELLHAPDNDPQAFRVINSNVARTQRKIVVKSLSSSNYFKLRTVGLSGEQSDSFPVLVQTDDQTPPKQVQALQGVIDTLGQVHLSWKANIEPDLEGYHVFRKEKLTEEMTRITAQAIVQTHLTDTVQLTNLNDKVWYYVTATDMRKNQSQPSTLLELVKPDKVIPIAPLFKTINTDDLGRIVLQWERSFSEDVKSYHIFREENGSWQEIFAINAEKNKELYEYKDENVASSKVYAYMLKAFDKGGLWSKESPVVYQKATLSARHNKGVHRIKARQNAKGVILHWEEIHPELSYTDIYKKINNGQPMLWRSIPKGTTQTEDEPLESDTVEYLFKSVTTDRKVLKVEKLILNRKN